MRSGLLVEGKMEKKKSSILNKLKVK
jgi:hypothetical protein